MDVINISQKCTIGLNKINSIDRQDKKYDDVLASISTIIFEAARVQSTTEQFKTLLIENNVNDEPLELLVTLFEQHRETFIQSLSTIGISFPAIVDIDWRLDYVVRSKEGGKENSPLFLITLHVIDHNLIRYVDMIATEGELQDLLSKVKDAVKQVDRVISNNI
eukprot:gene21870-28311_t